MNVFLGVVLGLAMLGSVVVGATSFQLRSSDPAGNGLAQVFLVFSIIALWVLILVTLLIAGTRPLRQQVPWGALNAVTVGLFILAAASQAACVAVLSDRASHGLLRFLVQLSVLLTPLAAVAYAAWRGFSVPIPTAIATKGLAGLVVVCSVIPWLALLQLATVNREAASLPRIESLSYPALLVRDDRSVEVINDADGLRTMHTTNVVNRTSDPILIDSDFAMFALADLKLTKGSLGMIARGQGIEPVTFRLLPWEPSGTPENVLKVLLRVRWLNADPDKNEAIRARLRSEQTLSGMIQAITGDSATTASR